MSGASHDFAIGGPVWPGASKLIEEIGEVAQVLGKLIATGGDVSHWDGAGPLDQRLIEELGDVLGAIAFFESVNFTPTERIDIHARAEEKRLLFEGWHYATAPSPNTEPPRPWGIWPIGGVEPYSPPSAPEPVDEVDQAVTDDHYDEYGLEGGTNGPER